MVTILVIVYQTKHIFNHGRAIDESNPYMKFERNQVINDKVSEPQLSANQKAETILLAILIIVCQIKHIFKLELD